MIASLPADLDAYLGSFSAAEHELCRIFPADESLTIFDIGACEGEDTVRFARRFPRSSLIAFEPLPANQEIIRANFTRFGVQNATLAPVAMSDRAGTAVFHVSSGRPPGAPAGAAWNYGNKSSSLLPPAGDAPMHGWIEFKERMTVPTTTLDVYCGEKGIGRIDFVHMDVQGAERLVLEGAARMLPHITAIWLEVSQRENYRGQVLDHEIRDFMRCHGFRLSFKAYRGDKSGEGDHLYLNLRHPRTWPYMATRHLRLVAGSVKRAAFGAR